MKAVKLEAPWIVDCTDLPIPEPKDGEALLKIHAAGICGSDIGAFRGTNGLVSYPRVIGHELAGEIISIPEHNPKGLKPGDRVVVDPYLYCGHCYPCTIGRTNCCTDLHVLGVHVDGGMAEYFCHPADMLVPVPDDMTDIRGARTSAGEFEEALELIRTRKVDMTKLLTRTVTLEEVPDTIRDIEKNPGSYMKVVVTT